MIKYYYPDGRGFFQDDDAPLHTTRRLTEEWFRAYENVNHMQLPSQSNDVASCQAEYTLHV